MLAELLGVAFHDHDVVGLPVEEIDGVVVLGVHRVAGDDRASQVLEGVGQRLEAGDFVGLLADVRLGGDQCARVVAGGEEVDFPSLRAGRTPQRLPVDREPSQSLTTGLPVREPGSDRAVQGVRVDSGRQSPDRGFCGPGPFRDQRIDDGAEPFKQGRRRVGHPFTHGRQGSRSGEDRGRPSVPGASREGAVLPEDPAGPGPARGVPADPEARALTLSDAV